MGAGSGRKERRLGFLVSHPCDKNKDVARMGHPATRRFQRWDHLGSWYPTLESKSDSRMGHPSPMNKRLNEESCKQNQQVSFRFAEIAS